MRVSISYPPLESGKGVPLLSQNRQFQWFNNPTVIYPVVPASAATLLQSRGHEVIWDDAIARRGSYADWLANLLKAKPDLVAFESKTPTIRRFWGIVDEIKARADWDLKVALYGDHVTALPEETLANCGVDFVVTGGDYDFMLLSLAEALKGGSFDPSRLEGGFWWREGDRLRSNGSFDNRRHRLDELPRIDRDLTQWRLYAYDNGNFKRHPGAYTMAGRDCWYGKCTFCSWTTTYPKFNVRSPESVLDEVEMLSDRYGVKEVFDDTGTFPAGNWLKRFCEGVVERGLNRKVVLGCNMRFDALNLEQYRMMKKANFRFLLFGLESVNQKTLDRLRKGDDRETMLRSCSDAARAGLEPHLTVMFGYPWENLEDVNRTVDFGQFLMRKGYAKTLQSTIVVPYPGTPLFSECRENGWLKTEDWDRYDMREPIMRTPMGDEMLLAACQRLYRVAFHPEFILRRLLAIRGLDDLRFIVRGVRFVLGHLKDFSSRKNGKPETGA